MAKLEKPSAVTTELEAIVQACDGIMVGTIRIVQFFC